MKTENERSSGTRPAERDPHPDPSQKTTNFRFLTPPEITVRDHGNRVRRACPPIKRLVQEDLNSAAINDHSVKGTGFKAGATFKAGPGELHAAAPNCPPYPKTTFFTDARNPSLAPAVRYVAPSGAVVLGVGSYALSTSLDDKRVQRFARNAIVDMAGSSR